MEAFLHLNNGCLTVAVSKFMACSDGFLMTQGHVPRNDTEPSGLDSPRSISNQKNASQTCLLAIWWRQFFILNLNGGSCWDLALACVKLITISSSSSTTTKHLTSKTMVPVKPVPHGKHQSVCVIWLISSLGNACSSHNCSITKLYTPKLPTIIKIVWKFLD